MTDLTPQQIKKAVLHGLKKVGDRFARDPTPTDGSIQAALAIAVQKKTGRKSVARKKATSKKRA